MVCTRGWSKHHPPMCLYIRHLYHHSICTRAPEWNKLDALCTLHVLINMHFCVNICICFFFFFLYIEVEQKEPMQAHTYTYIDIDKDSPLWMVRTWVASTPFGLGDKLGAIIRRQAKNSINNFGVSIFFFLNCNDHKLIKSRKEKKRTSYNK